MNTEELAFVNRQLAGMLRSGIPLEAGLKKMTESMSSGRLKDQLGQLGDRLEKGRRTVGSDRYRSLEQISP